MNRLTVVRAALISTTVIGGLAAAGCTPTVNTSNVSGTTVKGSGTMRTETRDVSGFHMVHLSGAGKMIIRKTGKESLKITAEDNLLSKLRSMISSGTLVLDTSPGTSISNTKDILYELEVNSLDEIKIDGAGQVDASDLDTASMTLTISGAAKCKLTGKASALKVTIDGAGDLDAGKLTSKTATAENSGAAHALVNASDTLSVSLSGVGSIEYIGSPKVTKNISGLGTVVQRH